MKLRVTGRDPAGNSEAQMVAVEEAMRRQRKRRKKRGEGGDEADIKSNIKPHLTHTQ